ncbi:hypothetical protein [Clostridium isatidis]|uniref:Uncharacterized protein n=1 Tax=Clostridium isatidis TaxID=182773 RepID=A0A343J8Z3_9CLOT|nr:hypothetical protein [Clostridium isatidis]ASW42001.1 hypothetical protein BEN51_00290 [Clostridium isatidis]NLZ34001.1 hypothetical protein [Clostridiales bacterium]
MENEVFVKLNYKTIGEFKSLIVDRYNKKSDDKKYLICTGKYDKNGWTFIFKANSMKEAEDFIDSNSRNINKKRYSILEKDVHIQDFDTVQIPAFI